MGRRRFAGQSCIDAAAVLGEVDQPGVRQQLHQGIIANRFEQGATEGYSSDTQSVSAPEVGLDEHTLVITVANASEGAEHTRLQSRQNAKTLKEIDAGRKNALSAHFVQRPGTLLDDNYRNTRCGQGNGSGKACGATPDYKDSMALTQLTFLPVSRYPIRRRSSLGALPAATAFGLRSDGSSRMK